MTLNREQIQSILAKGPLLLVDEVAEMEKGRRLWAKLYVRPEFDFFKGHFPGAPVLPGVMGVEALTQAAEILLSSLDGYPGKRPCLTGIEGVKFKKKILPGDTLTIEVTLSEVREGEILCDGVLCNQEGEVATTARIALVMG